MGGIPFNNRNYFIKLAKPILSVKPAISWCRRWRLAIMYRILHAKRGALWPLCNSWLKSLLNKQHQNLTIHGDVFTEANPWQLANLGAKLQLF
jgi:hypothetical protein